MKKRIIIILSALLAIFVWFCGVFMCDSQSTTGVEDSLTQLSPRQPMPTTEVESIKQGLSSTVAPITSKEAPKLAHDLVAGGQNWKLSFSDKTLPPETQQRIYYDLNLVVGHLPRFEIDPLDELLKTSNGQELDRRVRFEGEGRRWNAVFQANDFGCLLRGGSESELYVPKSVTDAYVKSIEFEGKNKAAFDQLDQFLKRLCQLKERPIENVRELFVIADDFKSAEADLAAMPAHGFVEGWGGKKYREASILDISDSTGTPLEKYGQLIAKTYAISPNKFETLPMLVYHQGQWRFLLQRPPT